MEVAKRESFQQVEKVVIVDILAKCNIKVVEPFIDDFMNPDPWRPESARSVISILQSYALSSEVGLYLNIQSGKLLRFGRD